MKEESNQSASSSDNSSVHRELWIKTLSIDITREREWQETIGTTYESYFTLPSSLPDNEAMIRQKFNDLFIQLNMDQINSLAHQPKDMIRCLAQNKR